MNRLEADSIWWKSTALGSVGKPCTSRVLLSKFYEIRKKRYLTQHPADKYRGEQMRATACIIACSPPTASVFFLVAQARKLSLSSSLERAEAAFKRHARNNDSDSAIEDFSCSAVFWVDRLVLVALGRSTGGKIVLATAGVRCAMVCIRGHGCCPGRHPLRFTIYCLVWGLR